jgi:hypothetical protein
MGTAKVKAGKKVSVVDAEGKQLNIQEHILLLQPEHVPENYQIFLRMVKK